MLGVDDRDADLLEGMRTTLARIKDTAEKEGASQRRRDTSGMGDSNPEVRQ